MGRGNESLYNGPGQITKSAATSIYGKNLQIYFSISRSYDLETWQHLGTQALQTLC